MTPREDFLAVKAKLDALDSEVGNGIRALEAALAEAGVAVPFTAVRLELTELPPVRWSKDLGTWRFHVRQTRLVDAPRHVRRAFFRAVTLDGLFAAAAAAYRVELVATGGEG